MTAERITLIILIGEYLTIPLTIWLLITRIKPLIDANPVVAMIWNSETAVAFRKKWLTPKKIILVVLGSLVSIPFSLPIIIFLLIKNYVTRRKIRKTEQKIAESERGNDLLRNLITAASAITNDTQKNATPEEVDTSEQFIPPADEDDEGYEGYIYNAARAFRAAQGIAEQTNQPAAESRIMGGFADGHTEPAAEVAVPEYTVVDGNTLQRKIDGERFYKGQLVCLTMDFFKAKVTGLKKIPFQVFPYKPTKANLDYYSTVKKLTIKNFLLSETDVHAYVVFEEFASELILFTISDIEAVVTEK